MKSLRKMRRSVMFEVIGALVLTVSAGAQEIVDLLELVAGRESRFTWPRLDQPIKVFLPVDWTPTRKWPLLMFYHGTGGRPSISLPRSYTEDKGFVIVGMTYTVRGPVEAGQSKQYYEDTVAISQEVRDHLAKVASVDPERMYIGGFSKGGWTASYFADKHPELIAGAMIMGAGVNPYYVDDDSLPRFRVGTPLYVGAGQLEMNYAVNLQALDHFGGRGAKVTLDIWDGLGHRPPFLPNSEYLEQWLLIESHQGNKTMIAPAFEKWLKAMQSMATEAGKSDPVLEYFVLERAGWAPFAAFLSKQQKSRFSSRRSELRKKEAVATEWELRRRYESTRKREGKGGFRLSNWEKIIVDYFSIYEAAPDSVFAKRAGLDAVRILESIQEAARRRERENNGKVEFLTKKAELVEKVTAIPAKKLREEFKKLRATLSLGRR
jgi:predicted esterase